MNVTTAFNAQTNSTIVLDTYNPGVFDPNFTYLLTQTEYNSLTSSIVIPTEQQLLSEISAGLLETTTSTQVNVEDPNITATNIVIHAVKQHWLADQSGDGSDRIVPGQTLADGSPVQLALASADRSDLNFLQVPTANAIVNFGVNGSNEGTMTLVGGPLGALTGLDIVGGVQIYIGGTSQNATTAGGDFLTVLSVSGSLVTFSAGQTIVPETSQSVTVELRRRR